MKIFGKLFKKKEQTKQLSELVELYSFFNGKQTEALNSIVSFRFGNEYQLPPVTIEQQIQGLRSHLWWLQNEAIKRENYEAAAKYRDDIIKTDFLLQDLYKSKKQS